MALETADGEAALTQSGRFFYLSGWPDETLADHIVRRLCQMAGIGTMLLPRDIRVRDNGDLRYVFNYGDVAADISAIADGRSPLLGESLLSPCGVAVFKNAT